MTHQQEISVVISDDSLGNDVTEEQYETYCEMLLSEIQKNYPDSYVEVTVGSVSRYHAETGDFERSLEIEDDLRFISNNVFEIGDWV